MQHTQSLKVFKQLVFIALLAVLFGRSWQFLIWDAPLRTLFWDQNLLEPFVLFFSEMTWSEFVISDALEGFIQNLKLSFGLVLLSTAIACFFVQRFPKLVKILLWFSFYILLFVIFLRAKEKFYQLGQFFEHASQLGVIPLYIAVISNRFEEHWLRYAKVLVALTFICHGLYAIGYYPRPGNFVDMTIKTLGCTELFSHELLFYVGIVDIVVALLIFVPKIAIYVLWYVAFWGLFTAFLRVTTGVYMDFFWDSFLQVWHTTVYRWVHGLLPLSLIFLHKYYSITAPSNS
ncbi:MAG: hypothetical protein ACPHXR_03740 [Flavicella sp.]